jgi:hypothetical protein
VKIRVRYHGGKLNGRSFNGHRNQPKYRAGDGTPLTYRYGHDLIMGARQLGAIADIYCLADNRVTYEHLSVLLLDIRTRQIRELLSHAAQHPEDAGKCEAEICEIEGLTA